MVGKLLPTRQTFSKSIKANEYNLIVVTNDSIILQFLRQLILRGTYLNKTSLLKSMTLDKLFPKRQTHSQSIYTMNIT